MPEPDAVHSRNPIAHLRSTLKQVTWIRAAYHGRIVPCVEWVTGWMAIAAMLRTPRRRLVANADVLISLTTYGKRLPGFGRVLESLLRQEADQDYGVSVYLCKADLPDGRLPPHLEKFRVMGVSFILLDENVRSYKKLVYAYRDNPGRVTVTADDDVIYPSRWLQGLLDCHRRHPDCVVAYRAHFLISDGNGSLRPYVDSMNYTPPEGQRLKPSLNLLPTGVSGVLYPPHSLDPVMGDQCLFMKHAPNADDIWFKLAGLMRGTRCVQVEDRNVLFPAVPSSQGETLNSHNVANHGNDVQLKASFDLHPAVYLLLSGN